MAQSIFRILLLLTGFIGHATVYGQIQPPWLGNQTNAGHIDIYAGQPGAWHLAGTEDYTYTSWGDPLTYVYNDSATNKHKEYSYDAEGRLISRIYTSGTFADTILYFYTSFPTGLLKSVTNKHLYRGSAYYLIQHFTYDQVGRLDSLFYKDSLGSIYMEFTKLSYDTSGKIKRIATYMHSNPLLNPELISDYDSLVYAFNRPPSGDAYRYATDQAFDKLSDFLPSAYPIGGGGYQYDSYTSTPVAYRKIGSQNGRGACSATYQIIRSVWQRMDSSCLEITTDGLPQNYQFYSFDPRGGQYISFDTRTYDANGNLTEQVLSQTGSLGIFHHRKVFSQYITATQPRLETLRIHPNPASGFIQISGLIPGQKINLTDALGRALPIHPSNNGIFNVTGIPSGLYTLRAGNRQVRFIVE